MAKTKQKAAPAKKLSPSQEAFRANLKTRREKAGLTQAALAEAVGVTVSHVSMLENGRRSPPLDTIDAIAKALKVKAPALLEA